MSQEFRLKSLNETKNYFHKQIEQNEWMRKKHEKICETLNHAEHFLF